MKIIFGDCVLDPDRRELTRRDEAISIGPQVFDLLVYLVQSRERVVTRDDLIDAVWRGRIVSESTITSHINAVRRAIGDNGAEQRLVRTIARKGYRFVGQVLPAETSQHAERDARDGEAPLLPDRPSIAVLPFHNLSGDPAQDYFVDGVVEDIIAGLSRISWLFVIARNSSFAYRGRTVDERQVGRELGVRYLLEGSLRKAANRIRIAVQLVDAGTGANLWSEHLDGEIDDIFELQDRLTETIVGAFAPRLEHAEIERATLKPTASLDAYDYYLRGMRSFHLGTRESLDHALALFQRATGADPEYASAHGMAAFCLYWRKISGWSTDRQREVAEGARFARRAVQLGRDDALALTRGGHALAHFGGDLDQCIALLDRSLILNPNLTVTWHLGGFQRISRGAHEEAIGRLERAMRLSPVDPEMGRMQTGMAMAHLFLGRFEDASRWAGKAALEPPSFTLAFSIIAASHALAGRTDEARRAMQSCRDLTPGLRLANIKDWVLLKRTEDLDLLTDGLRKAGLPD